MPDSTSRRLLAALAITAGVLAAASPAAADTWLTPVTLSNPAQSSEDADVAFDRAGDATFVWREFDGSNWRIKASVRPAGGAVGPAQFISAAGQNADEPSVDMNAAGNAVAVWQRSTGTRVRIELAFRPAGGAFAAAVPLSDSSTDASDPDVGLTADGTSVVAWIQDGFVKGNERSPGGAVGVPHPVSGGAGMITNPTSGDPTQYPSVTVSTNATGAASIAWVRGLSVENVVRSAGGAVTPVAALVSGDANPGFAGSSAIDALGNVSVVWETYSDIARIYSAFRPAGSNTLQGLTNLDDTAAGGAFLPVVALDDQGTAIHAWIRRATTSGSQNQVRYSVRPINAAVKPSQDVSAPGQTASHPVVLFDDAGTAILAWNRQESGGYRVQAATRPRNGDFGAVTNVSTPGGDYDQRVGLGVDAQGNAVADWFRFVGGKNVVEAAGLDRAGPRLDGLSVPASGAPGAALAFGVAPLDVWSPVSTSWAFGDGAAAAGTSVSHAFAQGGAFGVTVTATDAVGNATSATRTVNVGGGVDADGDGFFAGQDCNDHNPKINPAAKEIRGNRIDEDCDGRAQDLPDLTSSALPLWSVTSASATLSGLQLKNLKKGWRVTVSCSGTRCPFKSKRIKNKKVKRGSFQAIGKLGSKRTFHGGQTLTIRFTAPGYNTKFSIFKIKAGKLPSGVARCQTRGAKKRRACH